MAIIDDAIQIKKADGRCSIDITPVTSDPELFASACHDMYEMFEREVCDIIIATKVSGDIFASAVADRTHRGLAVATLSSGDPSKGMVCEYEGHHGTIRLRISDSAIRPGMRVGVVCDVLRSGKDLRAVIDMVEAKGAKVIKIGCFAEDSASGARKGALKGIPLESRVFTEDY